MLIMRATDEAKRAYETADMEQIINAMGAYNESLIKAGVLLAGEGLADDMSEAFVVDFSAETPSLPTALMGKPMNCSTDSGFSRQPARKKRSSGQAVAPWARATNSKSAA